MQKSLASGAFNANDSEQQGSIDASISQKRECKSGFCGGYSLPAIRGGQAQARDLDLDLRQCAAPPAQREARLHYLAGKIDVELVLPLASFVDAATTAQLQATLVGAARGLEWFGDLRIVYG